MADEPSKRIDTKLATAAAVITILGFFGIANWDALAQRFWPDTSSSPPPTSSNPLNTPQRTLPLALTPGCDLSVSGYLVTQRALALKAELDGSKAALNALANNDPEAARKATASGNAESARQLREFAATLDAKAAEAVTLTIRYDLEALAGDLRREAQDLVDENHAALEVDQSQFAIDQQRLFDHCGGR
jgi:hypothetical protein